MLDTPAADEQEPDMRPGDYFVDARDGSGPNALTWLLSGPYKNNHAGALADLEECKGIALRTDPKAVFYSFGTCRYPENSGKVGILQKHGLFRTP